jgi:tetratricopeptide (TPR) repeat protein
VLAPPGWKELTLHVRSEEQCAAQLYWSTERDPQFKDDAVWFDVPPGRSETTAVKVRFNPVSRLTGLRLRPGNSSGIHWKIEAITLTNIDALPPDDPQFLSERATTNARLGRLQEAANDFATGLGRWSDKTGDVRRREAAYQELAELPEVFAKVAELRPQDVALRLHRARWFAERGELDKAAADFAAALELLPEPEDCWHDRGGIDSELARQEDLFARVAQLRPTDKRLWIARMHFHAQASRWQEAAASLARWIELDPSDHAAWYHSGALRLYLGDLNGYRESCQEMVKRFGKTDDPAISECAAKTCLLMPEAVPDLSAVARLAEQAVTGTQDHASYPWFLIARGTSDFRAGQFAGAIEWLRKGSSAGPKSWSRDGMAYLILAMAHHRLGRSHEACEWLDNARQLEQKLPALDSGRLGTDWADRLRFHILRREAETLLGINEIEREAFVLQGRRSIADQKFDTLVAAVSSAYGDDTIEVRGNGPFFSQPISIQHRALTIRAGAGYRPVIKFDSSGDEKGIQLLLTDSPLVLEARISR